MPNYVQPDEADEDLATRMKYSQGGVRQGFTQALHDAADTLRSKFAREGSANARSYGYRDTVPASAEDKTTMNPPSTWEGLKNAIIGEPQTVQTRRGPVDVRVGGLPGLIARGKPMAMPGVISVPRDLTGPQLENTAIHEQFGHKEGRAGGYDFKEQLANPVKSAPDSWKKLAEKHGISPDFFKPSEIYAYTTQPAELSVEDMRQFNKLMQDPEYAAHFEKYKNPNTDWDFNKMQEMTKSQMGPSKAVTEDPAYKAFIEQQKRLASGG